MPNPVRAVVTRARIADEGGGLEAVIEAIESIVGTDVEEEIDPESGGIRWTSGARLRIYPDARDRLTVEFVTPVGVLGPAGHVALLRTVAGSCAHAFVCPDRRMRHLPSVAVIGQGYAGLVRDEHVAAAFFGGLQPVAGLNIASMEGRTLLSRGLDILDLDAFEQAVMGQNLALWRNSFPGLGRAGSPPEEGSAAPPMPPGTLERSGVDGETGEVEYTALSLPGVFVRWWELADIAEQVRAGRLPDGTAVSGVRVVFRNADAATRNLVPLLDAGAQVWAMTEDGGVVALSWD